PVDLLVELAGRHHGHRDLSHDDALAVDPDGDVALLDLPIVEDPRERLGDGPRVHDVPIDDRLRRERRPAPADDLQLLARLFELHDLDRARPDIDADEILAFGHPDFSESSVAPAGEGRQKGCVFAVVFAPLRLAASRSALAGASGSGYGVEQ